MNVEKAREVLIDHSRSKLNGKFSPTAKYENQMTNPLCGDHVQIKFNLADGKITEFGFSTKACAICAAATSLMSEAVHGHSPAHALQMAENFELNLLAPPAQPWPEELLSLLSFEHLKINQARRSCAILPWIALRCALKEIS